MADLDCDVLVIGAGIGGLSIAALMAKQGRRVIVLEQGEQPGGSLACVERQGYRFQTLSTVFSGFELGGGHERVLAALSLLVSKEHVDPGWQFILPNHRLDFYGERLALLEEIRREFPRCAKKAAAFFQRLDEIEAAFFDVYQHKNFIAPYTLAEKYHYLREVQSKLNRVSGGMQNSGASLYQQYLQDRELKRLLDLAVFFYSLHPLENCPALLSAFILGIPKRGVIYFPGGGKTLVDALAGYLQKRGALIRCNCGVRRILLERQQAVGVQLADGSTMRAAELIADTSLAFLYRHLLAEHGVPGKIRRKLEFLKPEWMPFSLYLGVDGDIIPEQMCEHVFLCNDYRRPIGAGNSLFINISSAADARRAPDGKRALTISCFFPYDKRRLEDDDAQYNEAVREQMLRELSRFLVFLDEGLEYQELVTPADYRRRGVFPLGALSGLAHTPSGFGFNGFSSHTTYKHLWILGEDTFPGRGGDLVSIGALNLAQLLSQA